MRGWIIHITYLIALKRKKQDLQELYPADLVALHKIIPDVSIAAKNISDFVALIVIIGKRPRVVIIIAAEWFPIIVDRLFFNVKVVVCYVVKIAWSLNYIKIKVNHILWLHILQNIIATKFNEFQWNQFLGSKTKGVLHTFIGS